MSEQPSAPYLDAVVAYGLRGPTRFHVPGHKGGPGADPALRAALGENALLLDVPQEIEGIDIGPRPTPYEEAERLAAEAYGAARTWFLTGSATQGNHALCLAQAPLDAAVVVQRNSHTSLIDGLVLSGGRPTFVLPEYDDELGIAHGLTPNALERALSEAPAARTAFVVSPTYYGLASDVAVLAEVAHAHDAALVVDQAWGSHFGFHHDLPPSALSCGADAVLTSTHKIVGSLTQTAMLHLAPDGRIDSERLDRAVRLTCSTSPSSLLLISLDAARRQLAVHGEALIDDTLRVAARARTEIEAVSGCKVLGPDRLDRPGVVGWDPFRLAIDVRGTGRTGYEVAAALRDAYDLQPELATHALVVLVLGIAQPLEPLERLAHDFAETIRRIGRPDSEGEILRSPAPQAGTMAVTPREAYLGPYEVVPVEESVGRVSCESIAGYPPGIPALLPGEEITAEVIGYLRELRSCGARLHGAADQTFETVVVRLP